MGFIIQILLDDGFPYFVACLSLIFGDDTSCNWISNQLEIGFVRKIATNQLGLVTT